MQSTTWKHPELGSFGLSNEYGYTQWLGEVDIPAFAVFQFRGSRLFLGSKSVPLRFCSWDEGFQLSEQLVGLGTKIIANQDEIAMKIKTAFYQDILGTGPDSGMWWHNDDEARKLCGEILANRLKREQIESPDDFDILLGEPSITIWDGEPNPIARIEFGSAFEDEHGAEAITDGTKILGLGYQGEASPYLKDRR